MNEHLQYTENKKLEKVKKALERNNMQAHIVQTVAEVVPLVKTMIKPGDIISNGGSVSLAETGVMELLHSGEYNFLDRDEPGADLEKLFRQVFTADAYFASAQAITEKGEIYQMDGRGNRVAAMVYGPLSVILIVGRNKIVEDLDAARLRNKRTASPANCHRLDYKTPCSVTGECADCHTEARICCSELVMYYQKPAGRVKVILVNEELGF